MKGPSLAIAPRRGVLACHSADPAQTEPDVFRAYKQNETKVLGCPVVVCLLRLVATSSFYSELTSSVVRPDMDTPYVALMSFPDKE